MKGLKKLTSISAHAVLDLVLIRTEGIEGGFEQRARVRRTVNGFLAYAFPTYEGSGVKRDVPEAETPPSFCARPKRGESGPVEGRCRF